MAVVPVTEEGGLARWWLGRARGEASRPTVEVGCVGRGGALRWEEDEGRGLALESG